jgi:hypothetical protein
MMPLAFSALILSGEGSHRLAQTALAQPIIRETGPPPEAADRAERIFEWVGIGLLLVIVVSIVLTLIRPRR